MSVLHFTLFWIGLCAGAGLAEAVHWLRCRPEDRRRSARVPPFYVMRADCSGVGWCVWAIGPPGPDLLVSRRMLSEAEAREVLHRLISNASPRATTGVGPGGAP